MRRHPSSRRGGFTIAELIIGVSLSLMVMTAVLSSYVFVARSYTRTIGFGDPNQPTLEAQGRRTLAYFTQDVQLASAVTSPSDSQVTLTVPQSTGGTKNVIYYYNKGTIVPPATVAVAETVGGYSVPPKCLARIDVNTSTGLTLHSSLLSCTFSYYDNSGNPYTSYVNYLLGIKQVSLTLSAQAGTSRNGTLTSVYQVASPRLLLRNKTVLP
ncbi:MAG: hypothetical protein NTV51_07480 [Verrucomicrobia bacterium]|nr:hypothetical protein [Verrucomicrobiota bacterium]